jgi:hypothetical protein
MTTLFGHLQMNGQSLTPFVIGSAGAAFESPNGILAWTIGEPLSATYRTQNFLTQGFHQPTTIVVTGVHVEEEAGVIIYPNPVRDILNVQASQGASYQVEMCDMQGQRLVSERATLDDLNRVHRIDVRELPVALYILRITNSLSGEVFSHKIEKY